MQLCSRPYHQSLVEIEKVLSFASLRGEYLHEIDCMFERVAQLPSPLMLCRILHYNSTFSLSHAPQEIIGWLTVIRLCMY
jgi:hypothetical protein